ncbi:MAG TPA: ABC transporter permease, partial [Thermomicrobiales bacterium]|nr:ABC transporter permease [Thermomicrobiales bacterium]
MARYLIGRVAGLVFVLFAVSIIAFALMQAVPGGPFGANEKGGSMAAETLKVQKHKYGLDQPVYVQYVKYMYHAVQGDFGVPFQSPTETVTGLIARAWPATLKIGICTILLAYSVGTLFGFLAARHQNGIVDYVVSFTATLGIVLPSFVVAMWMVLIFSIYLNWLPSGGWGSWKEYIMPVIAYSLAPMALVARYTRG